MQTPLERFLMASECCTQLELANFLGIRQSFISDAKRRGIIPADWLDFLKKTKGINPEWVLTGTPPQYEDTGK